MVLPANFQSWEHLQDVIRKVHNKAVKEEFSDTDDDDISTPRSSLKQACLIQDNDTSEIVSIRMMFYYFSLRKAQDLQQPYYGMPIEEVQVKRKTKPKIELYFLEDLNDIEPGYAPVSGEISFRLMDETSNSLSESNLTVYANKIKSIFGAGDGLVWRKGKEMVTYSDWEKGYQLQILCRDKNDGKTLISKVLDLQNHTPDWAKANLNKTEDEVQAYPINPGTQVILGKSRKKPRRRPIADVRFRYATIHIHGIPLPIPLFDLSGVFLNPIVKN